MSDSTVRFTRVPNVGDAVTEEFAYLFERTDRYLAALMNAMPAGQLQTGLRPTFTHVWQFRPGDVFAAAQSVPVRIGGALPAVWYGVFVAPSLVARCAIQLPMLRTATEVEQCWWGTDMQVQFVRGLPEGQSRASDWEFFHAPDAEPAEAGAWWRTRKGLELLTADERPDFHAAFLKALSNQTERHSREQRATHRATTAVLDALVARGHTDHPT